MQESEIDANNNTETFEVNHTHWPDALMCLPRSKLIELAERFNIDTSSSKARSREVLACKLSKLVDPSSEKRMKLVVSFDKEKE